MNQLYYLPFFILLFTNTGVSAQQYWSKRFDFDKGNEDGFSILKYNDDMVVHAFGLCRQNTSTCFGLMKFTEDGELQWKSVVYDTIETNHTQALQIRNDTFYFFADYQNVPGKYFTILAFDKDGNYLTKHDFGDTGGSTQNWARNMSFEGNSAFVTYNYKDTVANKQVRRIVKFNQDWSIAWQIPYAVGKVPPVILQRVQATPDGGCIISYTYGYFWEPRLGIEKFDQNGHLEWEQGYYSEQGMAFISNVVPIADGGYYGQWNLDTLMISVFQYRLPPIIFRLDAQGNYMWQKIYEGNAPHDLYSIFTAQNGDLITVGQSLTSTYDSTIVVDPVDGMAGHIRRFNKDGEEVWSRRISDYSQGGSLCYFVGGTELANHDLVFTGSIEDTLPDDPYISQVWLVKVDSNGCFNPGCTPNQTVLGVGEPTNGQVQHPQEKAFVFYPLPFKDKITVASVLGIPLPSGTYQIEIFSSLGQLVLREAFDPNLISSFVFPPTCLGNDFFAVIKLDGRIVQQQVLVRY